MAYYETAYRGQTDGAGNATVNIQQLPDPGIHFLGFIAVIVGSGTAAINCILQNKQGEPIAGAAGLVPIVGPMLHKSTDTHLLQISGAPINTSYIATLVGDANENVDDLLVRPQPTQAGQSVTALTTLAQLTVTGGTDLKGATTIEALLTLLGGLTNQGALQQHLAALFAQGPEINITHPDYGAKGDARWVGDAGITTGTAFLSSATAGFAQTDVGKSALVAGAGAAGGLLTTTILSVQSSTNCTLAANAGTTVAGARACFGTDNYVPIQSAINIQQTTPGSRLKVPHDSFGGKYLVVANPLIASPGAGWPAGFSDSTQPLLIDGDGWLNSVLVCGQSFTFNGLLGYNTNVKNGQIIARDLGLDGNYVSSGGVLPFIGNGALLGMPYPYQKAGAEDLTKGCLGTYHFFERCRFYRPTAYVAQGCHGIFALGCLIEKAGQADSAGTGGLDNFGSAAADLVLLACTFKDSTGNFVDLANATSGQYARLIMAFCQSFNHGVWGGGGIYGASQGSIMAFNNLQNNGAAGAAMGYDATTHANNRANNIVIGNNLGANIVVGSGLLASLGDIRFGNIDGTAFSTGEIDIPGRYEHFYADVVNADFGLRFTPLAGSTFTDSIRWVYNSNTGTALEVFNDATGFHLLDLSTAGDFQVRRGGAFWGHAAVGAQPAAPVTLADVIAIIRGCGLSA